MVHVPKTIDNDYTGIDFTFGYFTAVEMLAGEIRNLLADAEASRSYFLVECMGRSAGWLAYGAAIAGEASLVISVEDITGKYRRTEEYTDPETGDRRTRQMMNLDEVVDRIVDTMLARERGGGRNTASSSSPRAWPNCCRAVPRRASPATTTAISPSPHVNLGRLFAELIEASYKKQTGRKRQGQPAATRLRGPLRRRTRST